MKVEIRLKKIGDAGIYDLVSKVNDITPNLVLHLSIGKPYYNAKVEAERLAVALNCDLWENDVLIRKTINRVEEEEEK